MASSRLAHSLKGVRVLLKQQDPSLSFAVRKNWGALANSNRLKIRKWLRFVSGSDQKILNLIEIPYLPKPLGFCSVSHCPTLGGAVHSKNFRVGFDVELTQRITAALAMRVSASHEAHLKIPNDLIWTIKEASFKTVWPSLTTISEVQVVKFKKNSKNVFSFETLTTTGFAFRHQSWSFAVAFAKASEK
jgi:hypothetical protein